MTSSPRKAVEERRAALARLIGLFCVGHHDAREGGLCDACADLLAHAGRRVERCPHDPKPKCKDCRTHCYGPGYRERIRAVMRFSVSRRVGAREG